MTSRDRITRAMDHHRSGRFPEAEAGYREVLAHDPKNPDALHLLGTIVAGKGDAAAGAGLIARSLEIAPRSPEAHFNLANILTALSRYAEAERHFRAAYDLRPAHAEAANGIGGILLRLGRHEDAEAWLTKALDLDPQCTSALINMGTLMDATGRFSDTLPYYDRVLALHPDHAEAHQFRALALLARGRFDEGWREYIWRFKKIAAFHGRFAIPVWAGEPLAGRKILVWTEQGIGDEILAAGMIPDLLRAGAHVVLLCSPRLYDLFARSFPQIDLIPAGGKPRHPEVMANLSFQASVSDLGKALRPSFAAFPDSNAYLTADPALARALREKYKAATGAAWLVGLSWRSTPASRNLDKSIPLRQWAPVLRTPGVGFVNLQYGDTSTEVAEVERELGVKILTDREVDPLGNIDPFAAQVAALDLTITVSNTTAHVAGAQGARALVLIPANSGPLWYWFLERPDSPWYPSLRLFRQRGRDRERIMNDVATALAELPPAQRFG